MRRKPLIALLAPLLVTLWTAPGLADAYEDARGALQHGHFDEAERGFEAALAEAGSEPERWKARLGMALSSELSGELLVALERYHAFLVDARPHPAAAAAPWPERIEEVRATIVRLETRLLRTHGVLSVTARPEGAKVAVRTVFGEAVVASGAPLREFLEPGRYEVLVEREGYVTQREEATLRLGQEVRLSVALPAVPEPDPDPDPVSVVEPPPPPPAEAPVWPWVALGSGAASVAAGAVMTGLAAGDLSDLDRLTGQPGTDEVLAEYDRTEARMNERQRASWVLYGVGAAAVAVGVVGLVLSGDEEPAAEVSVEPRIGGGVASFRGAF